MNPYDRYCMENDVKPRKGEYMDTGIAVTYDTPLARGAFIYTDLSDFADFVIEKFPDCINYYIMEHENDYIKFLEERNGG